MFGIEGFGKRSKTAVEQEGIPNEPVTEEIDESRRNFLRQGAAAVAAVGVGAMGISPESAEAAENLPIEQVGLKLTNHQLMMIRINIKKMLPDAVSVEVSLSSDSNDPLTSVYLSVLTREGKVYEMGGAGADVTDAIPMALERMEEIISRK